MWKTRIKKGYKGFQHNPIWLTIYSDIITNLTLFFLMSYAFTRMDAEKKEIMSNSITSVISQDSALQTRANQVLKQLREQETISKIDNLAEKIQNYAKIETDEKMIKILLKSPVLFDTGKAELKEEAIFQLDEIAETLATLPNKIIVEGHTDNTPVVSKTYNSNWELSLDRASNVIKYFVEKKGLSPDRFILAGYGEYHPLFPNDTPENKAQNRRIEINILK